MLMKAFTMLIMHGRRVFTVFTCLYHNNIDGAALSSMLERAQIVLAPLQKCHMFEILDALFDVQSFSNGSFVSPYLDILLGYIGGIPRNLEFILSAVHVLTVGHDSTISRKDAMRQYMLNLTGIQLQDVLNNISDRFSPKRMELVAGEPEVLKSIIAFAVAAPRCACRKEHYSGS